MTLDPSTINSSTVWVPSVCTYPSGHRYQFYYTSYVQMYLIEKWVPTISWQGSERRTAYTRYDLPSNGSYSYPSNSLVTSNTSAQSDCPIFTHRYEQAENWNSGNEATYSYYFTSTYSRVIDPLDRYYRTDISGLTQTSKVFAGTADYGDDVWLKRVTVTLEKDSGPSYDSNVRLSDVKIEDGSYTRRTHYTNSTSNGVTLPSDVDEYQSNATSVYRRTHTDYTSYTTQHIYGLPSQVQLYSGAGTTLLAQTNFSYDESSYFDTTSYTVEGHDDTNYSTSFISGRGNLTTVTQYSVTSGSAGSSRAVGHTKYDLTGSVAAAYDGASHVTLFYYDDNFSNKPSSGVGATHGTVTKVKDADSYWSGAQYDWFSGQTTLSYHIAGTSGTGSAENIFSYSYGDSDQLIAVYRPDGGYKTWNYWYNWMVTATFEKIDANGGSDRTHYSFVVYDGAGQVQEQGADHADGENNPTPSITKYWGQKFVIDSVGRTVQASNVTAMQGDWTTVDDDVQQTGETNGGWRYTTIAYDALDRQTTVTRPDGNTVSYSYTGCGCAGSSTVQVTDERGKKRKTVADHLGRLLEAHDLNSSGGTYGKAVYTYNELDQLTAINHYNSSSAYQARSFSYDGYGRLTSQTTPEAGTLTYAYQSDDMVDYVENDRIVSGSTKYRATLTYNGRHLLTQVNYNDSDATPDVYYTYGEYGERTLMQEKNDAATVLGSTTYSYDTYKRLQTETRVFNGLSGTYSVGYSYNNVDAVTQVSYTVNSWTKNVNYGYTYAGALSGVGTNLIGTSATTTTNVINSLTYRGFGGVKGLNYGDDPRLLQVGYDAKRQQMTSLYVRRTSNSGTDNVIFDSRYDYNNGGNNNGRVQKVTDYSDSSTTPNVTTYGYDDYNRLTSASATVAYAYSRSYDYDVWGNLTGVTSSGGGESGSYTLSYATNGSGAPSTNRINNSGYSYDSVGNMTNDGGTSYTYDAANRLKTAGSNNSYGYDGDGRRVKQAAGGYAPLYYLWSSVLGQPVVELDSSANVYRAYVYGGGSQPIAMQSYDSTFYWVHADHLGNGRKLTSVSGAVVYRGEFDPHGQVVLEVGSATYLNSKKFTGYERDWATNLNYAQARMYYHNRGRFMQADPLGVGAADLTSPQSLNTYGYVGNDPVNFADPTGLLRICFYHVYLTHDGDKTYTVIKAEGCIDIPDIGDFSEPPSGGSGGVLRDPVPEPQSTREERCLKAVEDAKRISNEIGKTIAKSLAYPGGFDQGHVDKVIGLKGGLEDALRRIEQNCNNHEKKPLLKDIEGFQKIVDAPNPKVGDRLPIQEMKITAGLLNVLGAIGAGIRSAGQWIFAPR